MGISDYKQTRLHLRLNFHIEINILNAAFKAANIRISNDPVIDTRIPIYIHHCDEIHNWTCKRSKYYYDHIVEQVLVPPSSEQYCFRPKNY